MFNSTLIGGVAVQSLQPSNVSLPNAMSDVYEFYRIVKLRYRMHPPITLAAPQCAVYLAGIIDTPSSLNLSACLQIPHAAVMSARSTIPSKWCNVPPRALSSYMTWYKTVAGTPDPDAEEQGKLYIAGNASDNYSVELMITYEFKTPVVPGATPKMKADAALLRERDRLLRILHFQPTLSIPAVNPTVRLPPVPQ